MIYRPLGHSGLQVSALTLGSMMFGEQTRTEDALRIIDKAWDQGINFIDTADVYNAGRSEEIVGEAVARHRHDWVVASKVGFGPADGLPNRSGLSRKHIFNAVDATLTRMGMDYLDIYYLHREDHKVPLEETVQAIGDLLRQGKIRYWGGVQFPWLAHCRGLPCCRAPWCAQAGSQPAAVQHRQPPGRARTAYCRRRPWSGRRTLQPAGPGRAQWQVCAGRRAGRR